MCAEYSSLFEHVNYLFSIGRKNYACLFETLHGVTVKLIHYILVAYMITAINEQHTEILLCSHP